MLPYLQQYAGQSLVTGKQAEAYADHFIAVHLQEIGGGKTYSQLSAEAMAYPKGSPQYTAAEAKVQTVFQGTTLRGLLLEAYAFWQMGQIALYAAITVLRLRSDHADPHHPRLHPLAQDTGRSRDLRPVSICPHDRCSPG
jgi:hypothetical protein